MSSQPKAHRAPTRYSLRPEEIRSVISILQRRKGLSERQLSGIANHLGCAKKIIHEIAARHGYEIRPATKPLCQGKPRPPLPPGQTQQISQTAISPTGAEEERESELLNILLEEEIRMATDFKRREEDLLESVSDLEAQLQERAAALEEERERARQAISQTKALRQATREDRETLETLRGEITILRYKNTKLGRRAEKISETNKALRRELRLSMERERRLIETLEISEHDLENLRNGISQ